MSIPKIIHYCWFGGNPLPESAKRCIRSWKRKCPDYEIMRWDESNVDVDSIAYTREAYSQKAYAFVSDYFRLWAIYNYGGIYLDTDVEVVRRLDPLLSHWAYAGREGKEYINLGLGFGAEKHHPFVLGHMRLYEELHFIDSDGRPVKTTLPVITTSLLKELGFDPENEGIQDVAGFTIYPGEYFCPFDGPTGIMRWKTKNTYSIHHYDSSWYSDIEQQQKLDYWKACRKEDFRQKRNKVVKSIVGEKGYERLYMLRERIWQLGKSKQR